MALEDDGVKRLPPHITEADIAAITRIVLPTIAADAWDAGYRAGSVDGYFGTRDEKNPWRIEEVAR